VSRAPAGGGSIVARFVALDAARWLAPGELIWDRRGQIVAVRRHRGAASAVADVAVLPGLVDAHAHLQIPALPDAPRTFVPWVGAVMAARAHTGADAELADTEAAVTALLAGGATAVGDIDATGRAMRVLTRSGLVARCYRELTGFHLTAAPARALVRERMARPVGVVATGLSPHAPYSVSPALFAAAARRSRQLAIHCAETPEEQEFLRHGRGPFRDLLVRLGRLPEDFRPAGRGAVAWLETLGVLRPGTQLVHCQELERGDASRIAGAGASIVVCPGTIAWFGRAAPPVPTWLRAGIDVALGTDSRASNDGLSLVQELRRAAALWPALSPRQLFAMATTAGARSLGLPGAGRLRRGGRADFVVVPAAATAAATLASFVHGVLPLVQVRCAGRDRLGRGGGRRGR